MEYLATLVLRLQEFLFKGYGLRAGWYAVERRIRGSAANWASLEYRQATVDITPWFADAPPGVDTRILNNPCQRVFAVTVVQNMIRFLDQYCSALTLARSELGTNMFLKRQPANATNHPLREWLKVFSPEKAILRRHSGLWTILRDTDVFIPQVRKALTLSRSFTGSTATRALLPHVQQAKAKEIFWAERYSCQDLNTNQGLLYNPVVLFAGAPASEAAEIAALPNPSPGTLLRQYAELKYTESKAKADEYNFMYRSLMAQEAFVQRPRRLEIAAADILLSRLQDDIDDVVPARARYFESSQSAARKKLDDLENQIEAMKAYETELLAMGAAAIQGGAGGPAAAAGFAPHVEDLASLPEHFGTLGGGHKRRTHKH